jgi:hypothetical protein
MLLKPLQDELRLSPPHLLWALIPVPERDHIANDHARHSVLGVTASDRHRPQRATPKPAIPASPRPAANTCVRATAIQEH